MADANLVHIASFLSGYAMARISRVCRILATSTRDTRRREREEEEEDWRVMKEEEIEYQYRLETQGEAYLFTRFFFEGCSDSD